MEPSLLSAFVQRLCTETGMELKADDNTVVLQDDDGRDRLVFEQGRRDGALYLIAPVCGFVDPSVAEPTHLMLLQCNADTDDFGDVRIGADPNREIYVLMRRIDALEADLHAGAACDAMLERADRLAEAIRELQGSETAPVASDADPAVRV